MNIHIVGGGIIGLCTAFFLQKKGYKITIIEKNDFSDSCSHGNAGMIVPSHFIPLAAPGVISKGIRWMFNAKSPFFIKPRLSLDLWTWLWRFYKASARQDIHKAAIALRDLSWLSKQLYQEIYQNEPKINAAYQEKGLLLLYQTIKAEKEELETAAIANDLGIKTQLYNSTSIKTLEKNIDTNILGAIHYPDDAHLHPTLLMQSLIEQLKANGVTFIPNCTIVDFETHQNKVSHLINQKGTRIAVQEIVIAAGVWSAALVRKLGIRLLLQGGKGYSMTFQDLAQKPSIPSILTEAKVAITPMANDLRVGGTLEINHLDPSIRPKRVKGILESVPKYYPNLQLSQAPNHQIWHGFRPCSPDGLPYIGRHQQYRNVLIATGHAMMGLSLGPATGKLITELIAGTTTSIDLNLFNIER